MSKFDQIATFINVIEENGFAAAARKQGLSTAAISRQITQLESSLKTELLKRTTRQISLTEIGAEYYQHCKKTLTELREAELAIAGSQTEARGILRVMSAHYFAGHYLLPRLPQFMKENPKLKIKLELAERFPDLAKENIDLLFGVSMEGPPDLVRKRVATTRYVLCASPKYLKKHGTPRIPEDLIKHHYITHSMRNPDHVITFRNNKEVHVEPTLWLNNTTAMRDCALQHMGIVKLHDYIVADALKDGRLIELLPEFSEREQSVYLFYQKSRHLQPKIRKFIDFYTSTP